VTSEVLSSAERPERDVPPPPQGSRQASDPLAHLPTISIQRGGLRFGDDLDPDVRAALTLRREVQFAEAWVNSPVLQARSWYCARCRFTGPAPEHRRTCAGSLEAVLVTVTRWFPPQEVDW